MKKIGNKSLSALLLYIINIIWWLEWVAGIIIMSVFVAASFYKESISFSVPISFSSVNFKTVASNNKEIADGTLSVLNGNFSFQIHPDLLSTLIFLLGFIIVSSIILLITYQLKLILSSFRKNMPFVEMNIRRINNIGLLLIIFTALQWLFNILLYQFLISHFVWKDGIVITYNYNFVCLFTGLILIIVAEIFKLGVSLEEEQKLTI